MKHILVTGGLGFIGSHLAERLLALGHTVIVVDNMSSNAVYPRDLEESTRDWPGCLQLHAYVDIRSMTTRLMSLPVLDEIYHLASPVGPAGVLSYAGELVREVAYSTYAVMQIALATQAKVLDVSTSEVYGGGQQGLCAEDMPRVIQAETTVRLEYAVAKLAMETALLNWARVTGNHAVIVRPFNVAGPRQKPDGGFVLPRFIRQAVAGEALTVFGDGSQVRAFSHVSDIVDGLILAMERGHSGEVYNLGNPANRTTVLELAKLVIQTVGRGSFSFVDPKTIHGELFAEAADKFPDSTKAMQELGWQPMIGLAQIVADALNEVAGVAI